MKLKPQDVANYLMDDFNYIAMDKNGEWYAFEEEPYILDKDKTWFNGADCQNIPLLIDYEGDWKGSLFEKQSIVTVEVIAPEYINLEESFKSSQIDVEMANALVKYKDGQFYLVDLPNEGTHQEFAILRLIEWLESNKDNPAYAGTFLALCLIREYYKNNFKKGK